MGRCTYFITRKERACGQSTSPGASLCGSHSDTHTANCRWCRTRLRPAHLERHERKCPRARAEAAVSQSTWYKALCNRPSVNVFGTETQMSFDEALTMLNETNETVQKSQAFSKDENSEREAIEARWADVRNSSLKCEHRHFTQNAALCTLAIGAETDSVIELGAGRAYLAMYAAEMLQFRLGKASFFAIDRGCNRNKTDGVLRSHSSVSSFMRARVDITHLYLPGLPNITDARSACVLGKHVCGGATDAALRAVNELNGPEVTVVIAPCCRSTCTWESLHEIANEFIRIGIGRDEFAVIANRASWGLNRKESEEKARAGAICRLGIDSMRVRWLRRHGWDTRLVQYVPSSVTTENVCIVANRRMPYSQ